MPRRMLAMLLLAGCIAVSGVAATQSFDNPQIDAQVYVRSQGLYYDTIVLGPLPAHGRFQILEMGPNGLETDYGPGDVGYLGGRWAEDFDGDGVYSFFLCPLLPPGRENP